MTNPPGVESSASTDPGSAGRARRMALRGAIHHLGALNRKVLRSSLTPVGFGVAAIGLLQICSGWLLDLDRILYAGFLGLSSGMFVVCAKLGRIIDQPNSVVELADTSASEPAEASDSRPPVSPLPRAVTRTLSPLFRLAGSSVAIGTFLLVFGFLSTSALFGFAGLPMLSLDYTALVEAGASGIVDSVGLLFEGFRPVLFIILLGSAIALWIVHDQPWPWLRCFTRNAHVCLWAQLAVLVSLGSLLHGIIGVAQWGSQEDESGTRAAVQEALLRTDADSDAAFFEEERKWEATATIRGFWGWVALAPETASSVDVVSDYGQRIRLSHDAEKRARQLYGWIVLGVLSFGCAVIALRAWRKRLMQDTAPRGLNLWLAEGGRHRGRGLDPTTLLVTAETFIEPLLIVSILMALGLVPVAHGVLAHRSIGHEQVVVRLRPDASCRPDADPVTKTSTTGGSSGETLAETSRTSRNPPRECTSDTLAGLEEKIDAYAAQQQHLLAEREDRNAWPDNFSSYQQAVDELLGAMNEAGCVGAFEQVWHVRPRPGFYGLAPDAAGYFWDRWQESLARFSHLRFGYILSYPRGDTRGVLSLFETIHEQFPDSRGRWVIREIERKCIDEVIVIPDVVKSRVDDVERTITPDSANNAVKPLVQYITPEVLRTTVALLDEGRLPVNVSGPLISQLGILAGVFESHDPQGSRDAIELLGRILVDRQTPVEHRTAAATALGNAGTLYAAHTLAVTLFKLRSIEPEFAFGTSITAAGRLGGVVRRKLRKLDELDRRDAQRRRLNAVAERLHGFLRLYSDSGDSEERGATCTALHLSEHPEAAGYIESILVEAIESGEMDVVGYCVTGLGLAGDREKRPVIARVLLHEISAPSSRIRGAALTAMSFLGWESQEDLLLRLYRDGTTELQSQAALRMDEVDQRRMGQMLLTCAETGNASETMIRCVRGLLYIDTDSHGGGFVSRLTALAGNEQLKPAVCEVLHEFSLRTTSPADQLNALGCPKSAVADTGTAEYRRLSRVLQLNVGGHLSDAPSSVGGELTAALAGRESENLKAELFEILLQANDDPDVVAQLQAIARGEHAWVSAELRSIALIGLKRMDRLDDSVREMVAVFQLDAPMEALQAAAFINEVPAQIIGDELLACARAQDVSPEQQVRCLTGLLFVQEDAGSEETLTTALGEWLQSDSRPGPLAQEAGCRALAELRGRAGERARLPTCEGIKYVGVRFGEPFADRWRSYMVELAQTFQRVAEREKRDEVVEELRSFIKSADDLIP